MNVWSFFRQTGLSDSETALYLQFLYLEHVFTSEKQILRSVYIAPEIIHAALNSLCEKELITRRESTAEGPEYMITPPGEHDWFSSDRLSGINSELVEFGFYCMNEFFEQQGKPYLFVVSPRENPQLLRVENPISRFVRRMFPQLDLRLGNVCNVKCMYCAVHFENYRFNLTTEEAVDIMGKARSLNLEKVALTGGEPTIRNDLPALITTARDMGFRNVNINTNALMFSSPEILKKVISAGLDTIGFSFDTTDPVIADRLFQRPGMGKVMMRGVENLFRSGLPLGCICVITKLNYRGLEAIVEFFAEKVKKYGTDFSLNFDFVFPENLAWKHRSELVASMSEVAPYLMRAVERGAEKGLAISFRGIPKCIIRGLDEHCFDDYMCILQMVEGDHGNFDYSVLYRNTFFRFAPNCESCDYYKTCQGFFYSYESIYGTDEFRPVVKEKKN